MYDIYTHDLVLWSARASHSQVVIFLSILISRPPIEELTIQTLGFPWHTHTQTLLDLRG